MSAPYIISKYAAHRECYSLTYVLTRSRGIDPFFAMGIGIAAAAVRINREEKEKGKSTQQSVESFRRRLALAFGINDSGNSEAKKQG
jgi:hypothetical protein